MSYGNGQTASEAIWAMLQVYRNDMEEGQRSEISELHPEAPAILDEIDAVTHSLLRAGDALRAIKQIVTDSYSLIMDTLAVLGELKTSQGGGVQ